jgi:hypothetical protein
VAQVQDGTLGPYQTRSGDEIVLVGSGTVSPIDLFDRAHNANTMRTWGLRFLGWLLMIIGINLVLSPITTILANMPLIGGLLGSIASLGTCLVSISLSVALSFVVIAVSWFVVRPTLSIALLAAAVVPMIFLKMNDKRD